MMLLMPGNSAMLSLLVLGCLLVTNTQARSSGAPDPDTCGGSNMFPSGHPASVGPNDSPYGIALSATQYSAGGSLNVTLAGSESFLGFMILALPADDDTADGIGSFEVQDSSQSNLVQVLCSGKGLTHTLDFKSAVLDKLELKWSAPSVVAGNVIFYVTFVKIREEYWTKHPSIAVWDGVSPKPTTAAPGPVPDPTPLSPPVTNAGCGDTMGCYSECEGNNCDFLVTWKKKDDTSVEFEMFATLTDTQGYVALGLSNTATMADVSIIGCTANSRKVSEVNQYYSTDKNSGAPSVSTGPIDSQTVAAAVQTADSPKTMTCRFTYDNTVAKANLDNWKDLDTDLYLFVARGAFSGALAKHDETPKISPETVQLTDTNYGSVAGTKTNFYIKFHACFMVIAWVFCASIGLILARYYKPMWSDKKACGQKVWFSFHRGLMVTAVCLTIIAFILMLINNRGFRTPDELPGKAHPILGLIAIICALINPLIAVVRCHPGDSKRPIFNWVHWFFGTVAHIFAIVAIFLGMLLTNAAVPGWITYVMMVFCIVHVCVEFILEIHQCCMYDKNRDRQEAHAAANKGGNADEPQYAGRGFKCAMLVIYMIIVTCITIALVAIIAAGSSITGSTA